MQTETIRDGSQPKGLLIVKICSYLLLAAGIGAVAVSSVAGLVSGSKNNDLFINLAVFSFGVYAVFLAVGLRKMWKFVIPFLFVLPVIFLIDIVVRVASGNIVGISKNPVGIIQFLAGVSFLVYIISKRKFFSERYFNVFYTLLGIVIVTMLFWSSFAGIAEKKKKYELEGEKLKSLMERIEVEKNLGL